MIDKLVAVLGSDLENFGSFQPVERTQIKEEQWSGRKWLFNGMQYQLRFEEKHLRLYILFVNQDEAEGDH